MWNMVVVQDRPLISDDETDVKTKMIMCHGLLALITHCVGTQRVILATGALVALLCRNIQLWPRFFVVAEVRCPWHPSEEMLDPAEHLPLHRWTCRNHCKYSGAATRKLSILRFLFFFL